jgi:hypothetical protein
VTSQAAVVVLVFAYFIAFFSVVHHGHPNTIMAAGGCAGGTVVRWQLLAS